MKRVLAQRLQRKNNTVPAPVVQQPNAVASLIRVNSGNGEGPQDKELRTSNSTNSNSMAQSLKERFRRQHATRSDLKSKEIQQSGKETTHDHGDKVTNPESAIERQRSSSTVGSRNRDTSSQPNLAKGPVTAMQVEESPSDEIKDELDVEAEGYSEFVQTLQDEMFGHNSQVRQS